MRARRRPLRASMRPCSPLLTKKRLRRTSVMTPLFITSRLNRRSRPSNDSSSRSVTVKLLTSFATRRREKARRYRMMSGGMIPRRARGVNRREVRDAERISMLTAESSGNAVARQAYNPYGSIRSGGTMPTPSAALRGQE